MTLDIVERAGVVAVHDGRSEDHQTVLSAMSSAAAAQTHRSFHGYLQLTAVIMFCVY